MDPRKKINSKVELLCTGQGRQTTKDGEDTVLFYMFNEY